MVVDGEVVASDGLEVDESLVTGESDPVAKADGDGVLSGSFVAAGVGRYRATRVGADAYAARIAEDAHFREREVVVEVEDEELGSIPVHNVTPRLSGTPGGFRIPAPFVGQHNAELLKTLGFDGSVIDDLTKRGVLWQRKQRKGK